MVWEGLEIFEDIIEDYCVLIDVEVVVGSV